MGFHFRLKPVSTGGIRRNDLANETAFISVSITGVAGGVGKIFALTAEPDPFIIAVDSTIIGANMVVPGHKKRHQKNQSGYLRVTNL